MKRVEGYNNLYRDDKGTIINTDNSSYQAYKLKKNKSKERSDSISSLSVQLEDARVQIEELKKLVQDALSGKFDK